MTSQREPLLKPVAIRSLKPTQITVGMREVHEVRARWKKRSSKKDVKFLERHLVPVVLGPMKEHYLLDHHHLCLALHEEGIREVLVTTLEDLSHLPRDAFWVYLDNRALIHPFDEKGKRRAYQDIPKKISGLVDDPYRSLAGALRREGAFAKDTTPFSEFLWADFLRRRIPRKKVERDFGEALRRARTFSHSKDASYLPGWCGPG